METGQRQWFLNKSTGRILILSFGLLQQKQMYEEELH